MRIEVDDLTRPAVLALLREHLANMHELSPPEQVFALDVPKLKAPGITFWTAWDGEELLGCAAVKELDARHGEIKSMRTPKTLRRRGAGRALLAHILRTAQERGYERLSLETGTHPDFGAAHTLYRSFGFTASGPFSDYLENPHSTFMTLRLADVAVQVRRARMEDADTIADFNLRMAHETEGKRLRPEVLGAGVRRMLAEPALGFYLVAEAGGAVVASLMITTEWSDWRNGRFWWIQSLYVVPAWRRRGVFRALYAEVKQLAEAQGDVCGTRLYVEQDNARAFATYRSLGMEETDYRIMEELRPGVVYLQDPADGPA